MKNIYLKIEEQLKLGKVILNYRLARLLSPYAPDCAGYFASKVWFTPLRRNAYNKNKKLISKCMTEVQAGVSWWTVGPESKAAATVVLIHGWGGSSEQFDHIALELQRNQFKVISFDFPSHGQNPGLSSDITEMKDVLHNVLKNTSGDIHLICHSFGLLVAGQVLKSGKHEIKSITAIASPLSFEFLLNQFIQKTRFDIKIYPGLVRAIQKRVEGKIDILKDIDLNKELFQNISCLFIYDELDKEVPLSEFDKILKFRPDASYLITQGLGHNKILRSPEVSERVIKFLESV